MKLTSLDEYHAIVAAEQGGTTRRTAHHEENAQAALMDMVREHEGVIPALRYVHHSPNGGARTWKKDARGNRYSPEGQRMKRMGVRDGFPDLILPWQMGSTAGRDTPGIVIELKYNGNTPSTAQRAWLAHYAAQGWRVVVIDEPTEDGIVAAAWAALMDYLQIGV